MMAMSSFGSRTRREKELSQLRPWVGHGERRPEAFKVVSVVGFLLLRHFRQV